jgi:hypothetical protein
MLENTGLSRTEALAQFNKITRAFITIIGMVPDVSALNQDFYVYHEIVIDPEKETISGTADDFRVVLVEDLPFEIREDDLNFQARDKIVKEYPLEKQLSIIGQLLETLADQHGVECEDLKDMNDYIKEVKRVNALRKEFFSSDPSYQYMSTADFEKLFADKYEGGINEFEPKLRGL